MADELVLTSAKARPWLIGWSVITVASLLGALASGYWLIAGIPLALAGAYLTIVNFKLVFFLLFFLIPFSTEVTLPGGFGTDLPDEPLMWLLTGIFLVFFVRRLPEFSARPLLNPITMLLLVHLSWMVITSFSSSNQLVSFKFLLAKAWYVVTFFLLPLWALRNHQDVRRLFWFSFTALMITVLYVLVNHAAYGFAFMHSNTVVRPFYRNHVNYACLLALFLPYVVLARTWYKKYSIRGLALTFSILVLLAAIQLSYTRAAYVALAIAAGSYFIVKWKLMRPALVVAAIGLIGATVYFVRQDHYLEYAPDFKRTITHYEFDNLLEATYKGEDISTMERVYRWVAGLHMVSDKPLLGFGPGNFYNFYRSYTVSSFETYVSNNPERSGIHSYYFMTAVEQGIPGLILFFILLAGALLYGEKRYHEQTRKEDKNLIMAVMLSLIIIGALLLINDMIETDKVGSFFFLALALLTGMGIGRIR